MKKSNFPTQHSPSHYHALVSLPHPPFKKRPDRAHCLLELCRNWQRLGHVIDGIDITVDLEVLHFWGAKIRAIVQTKAMYEFTLASNLLC